MSKNVRIIPKRRTIDIERLAEALLDLVASLDEEQRQRLGVDGENERNQLKGGRPTQRGSAA